MRRRHPVSLAVLASVVLLATGCGEENTDTDTETAAGSGTVSSAPATPAPATEDAVASAAPFPANTDPDSGAASADSNVTVTDVRMARLDGYDQVVFEVGGTGTPGWEVQYVPEAASQGSGDTVAVPGEAVLQVTLTGVGYPYDTGLTEWAGAEPLTDPAAMDVAGVVFDATFEGTSVAFIGTTGELPFRVYALEGPGRVVVEVADRT